MHQRGYLSFLATMNHANGFSSTTNKSLHSDDTEMSVRADEAYRLVRRLRDEGHRCIAVLESYPPQIRWCKQTTCIEAEK